jgi:hypothetical protein
MPITAEIAWVAPGEEADSETIEVGSDEVLAIGKARAYARKKAEGRPDREFHVYLRIGGRLQWVCGWYFGPRDADSSRGPGILNPNDIGRFVGDRHYARSH